MCPRMNLHMIQRVDAASVYEDLHLSRFDQHCFHKDVEQVCKSRRNYVLLKVLVHLDLNGLFYDVCISSSPR